MAGVSASLRASLLGQRLAEQMEREVASQSVSMLVGSLEEMWGMRSNRNLSHQLERTSLRDNCYSNLGPGLLDMFLPDNRCKR